MAKDEDFVLAFLSQGRSRILFGKSDTSVKTDENENSFAVKVHWKSHQFTSKTANENWIYLYVSGVHWSPRLIASWIGRGGPLRGTVTSAQSSLPRPTLGAIACSGIKNATGEERKKMSSVRLRCWPQDWIVISVG